MKRTAIVLALLGVVAAIFGLTTPAEAQLAYVVQSCPTTRATPYTLNTLAYLTVDVNGTLCTNATGGGGGGGLSVTDSAAWTTGVSAFTPSGGEYNSSPATLSSGQQGTFAMSAYRNQYVDTPTSNNNLYAALTAAAPCLNATAFNTNSYSTGQTNPANCDLNGNLYANNNVTNWGGVALGAMANYGTSPGAVKVPGVNASMMQGTTAVVAEPCQTNARTSVAINLSGTSGLYTTPILAGTSSNKTYICQIVLNNNAAVNVAIFEAGTGTSCSPSTGALWGGSTAATGFQFAANGGISLGVGGYYIKKTATANDDICAITNGNTQITGSIQYVQVP